MYGTKNFFYIGVKTENGVKLVTKIDNATRSAYWKDGEQPKQFSSKLAEDLAEGLVLNGFLAFVVKSRLQIMKQF